MSRNETAPKTARTSSNEDAVFAALDLGTNNCRLLIAKPENSGDKAAGGLKVIDSFSRIVRLGEGLSATGELSPEAMNRTISALKVCHKKLERQPIMHARYVATEACRQASNSMVFLERVRKEAGLDIQVISTEEEAKLAFMGCATLLRPEPENALVFDIGGGSTEFMWVSLHEEAPANVLNPPRIRDWFSLPQGVMNLSEKFGGNAFAEVYFDELVEHLMDMMEEFDEKNGIRAAIEHDTVQMLSTSGTVTTLAAIHLGLARYERPKVDGLCLSTALLREATRKILKMRPSERFAHPCIGPDRSDYIISGCAIFEAICKLWHIPDITIADRGVREGIIISLIKKQARSA